MELLLVSKTECPACDLFAPVWEILQEEMSVTFPRVKTHFVKVTSRDELTADVNKIVPSFPSLLFVDESGIMQRYEGNLNINAVFGIVKWMKDLTGEF